MRKHTRKQSKPLPGYRSALESYNSVARLLPTLAVNLIGKTWWIGGSPDSTFYVITVRIFPMPVGHPAGRRAMDLLLQRSHELPREIHKIKVEIACCTYMMTKWIIPSVLVKRRICQTNATRPQMNLHLRNRDVSTHHSAGFATLPHWDSSAGPFYPGRVWQRHWGTVPVLGIIELIQ